MRDATGSSPSAVWSVGCRHYADSIDDNGHVIIRRRNKTYHQQQMEHFTVLLLLVIELDL